MRNADVRTDIGFDRADQRASVSQSEGGPHDMTQAIDDLETVRQAVDVAEWIVLGHSWGSDLAVRYALDHPRRIRGVAGIAGHGLHRDREWSAAYEAGKASEVAIDIDWVPEVPAAPDRQPADSRRGLADSWLEPEQPETSITGGRVARRDGQDEPVRRCRQVLREREAVVGRGEWGLYKRLASDRRAPTRFGKLWVDVDADDISGDDRESWNL